MQHQKHLFDLSDNITYLNGAYMAPQLKSVTEVGLATVIQKARPNEIMPEDFFTQREILKQRFATLVDAPDYRNIAIIPSVSYGIANAANNIHINPGDEIIVVDEQFPSNVYVWQEVASKHGASITVIKPPKSFKDRGALWNQNILNAITQKTALVAMSHVHWADGTLFDLKTIRAKTKDVNAFLIIDGTQSVGALPFSVSEIKPDAIICAGYKWLLGPYSTGVAYYGDAFNEGTPIEHNWMNRYNSEDFTRLTQYEDRYKEKAARYSVGESSNFVLTPMLIRAIEQLIEWSPEAIQQYCKTISTTAIQQLRNLGCFIEEDHHRAHHLFGIYLPDHIDLEKLKTRLKEENIFISFRGNAIRVSSNVYNSETDFNRLLAQFG
ncbi:selenocysteine lyase/cysteine desulfurase [Aquimarina sp. EL_43]|uniref:aminotransferase class V-fold PLP-dependent enzyme n=1 Tax=unclassified Aquimarina TaxID=2627091 RepID=UPI0018CA6E46|nr:MULTISPECIES: aminotransferase class V-fold PLP-dependent enzyme [unclassified Aquimarina]MBG6132757.1 selenocysteine lyase/cysteine desulfurase [Aquimarina sp. EL_35]MBG6153166.1 selenocysteine lyase/cysteine desulfurase [Aquimarina sp. EL_32]MBG6171322.1 selenocysteine lyase/cysteine desulfurase [Aquimarina sp. EL_43]